MPTTNLFDEYFQAEQKLIKRLSRMISSGEGVSNYEIHMMARYQKARELLIKDLTGAELARAKAEAELLSDAYSKANMSVYADLAATVKPIEVASLAKTAAMGRIQAETSAAFNAMNSNILRQTDDLLRRMVGEETRDVVAGVMTRQEASRKLLGDFIQRGGWNFQDASGRNWSAESYSDMAMRTATARTQIAGHIDAMTANGIEFAVVQPGARPCHICDIWARKILTLNGQAGTYTAYDYMTGGESTVTADASLDEARAAGFQHPNCRCTLRAYIVGVTDPDVIDRPEWDEAGYNNQQQQRSLERNLRQAKREAAGATNPDELAEAEARVEAKEKALESHLDSHGYLKRQRSREEIAVS